MDIENKNDLKYILFTVCIIVIIMALIIWAANYQKRKVQEAISNQEDTNITEAIQQSIEAEGAVMFMADKIKEVRTTNDKKIKEKPVVSVTDNINELCDEANYIIQHGYSSGQ